MLMDPWADAHRASGNFCEKLMVEGGLRQVAVHIDMTPGRAARLAHQTASSRRQTCTRCAKRFTRLGLGLRGKGPALPLEFAHNCTVTDRNVEFVPEIVRWALEKPERTNLWRLFSFQPGGRHRGVPCFPKPRRHRPSLGRNFAKAPALPLEREFSIFGHPDCNSWTPLLVSRRSGRFIVFPPQDTRTRQLYEDVACQRGPAFLSSLTTARTTPLPAPRHPLPKSIAHRAVARASPGWC